MPANERQALKDQRWFASVHANWTALALDIEHQHAHTIDAATYRVECKPDDANV
jgi:hypothetical protein